MKRAPFDFASDSSDICPKCDKLGPKSVSHRIDADGDECLAYRCGWCGYETFTECADASVSLGAERGKEIGND